MSFYFYIFRHAFVLANVLSASGTVHSSVRAEADPVFPAAYNPDVTPPKPAPVPLAVAKSAISFHELPFHNSVLARYVPAGSLYPPTSIAYH